MTTLQVAEKLLANMTRAEKAQVLQWVVRDLGDAFPGIESTSGVSGGEPRIVRTRIPVWLLVQARNLGTSEADLLRAYPTLRAEDLTPITPRSISKSTRMRRLEDGAALLQAARIHAAIEFAPQQAGQLIRISRPTR